MTTGDRRTFLKQSTVALSSLAVSRCSPVTGSGGRVQLDRAMLWGVGLSVLPSELGPEGSERVLRDFDRWVQKYEPVAELDHGYISSEIRYGPPDPAPRWQAQLEALELESRVRYQASYLDLSDDERKSLIRRQIDSETSGFPPRTAEASHVAVGILTHFYSGSEATDLCYGRRVGKSTCRGISTAPDAPEPLQDGA